MKKLNMLLKIRLFFLVVGFILGGIIVSIPWYFAWKSEVRQANATFFENLLDEPEEILLEKGVNDLHVLSENEWNWKFKDMKGDDYLLRDYSGKVIFLNFWSTWCSPCLAEFPSLVSLNKQFEGNEKVEFLFLTDESSAKVNRLLKRRPDMKGLKYFRYESELKPNLFGGDGIPNTIIINKNGEVVVEHLGAALWDGEEVIGLLNKLITE
ncbi:TlpA family protein disulfide reductase [Marinifilum flexuosum]|uniref:TlpA family protein disulfide reductase n=1 Tax=Marinifilum flexuosum TaxID=1117708 RepID=UPI002494BDA4|nr:TlpA disulfide reductase family protein [Marinifilum flexuosum]